MKGSNIFIDVNNKILDKIASNSSDHIKNEKYECSNEDMLDEFLGFSSYDVNNVLIKSDKSNLSGKSSGNGSLGSLGRSDKKYVVNELESSNFNRSMRLGGDFILGNIQDVSSEKRPKNNHR